MFKAVFDGKMVIVTKDGQVVFTRKTSGKWSHIAIFVGEDGYIVNTLCKSLERANKAKVENFDGHIFNNKHVIEIN